MTVTLRNPNAGASSFNAALARISSTRTATPASVNPYRSVTVRVTLANGEVTKVVAV